MAGQVLVGAGWDGAFMASGVLVRHQRFYWGLCYIHYLDGCYWKILCK